MAKKQEVEARHYDVVLAPHITEKAIEAQVKKLQAKEKAKGC